MSWILVEFGDGTAAFFRADHAWTNPSVGTQWLLRGVPVFALPLRRYVAVRRIVEIPDLPRPPRVCRLGEPRRWREPHFEAECVVLHRSARDLRRPHQQ